MLNVVFAVSGLFSLFTGWILFIILPDVSVFAWIIIALGMILLITAVILDFRRLVKTMSNARSLFGITSVLSICVFFGIVILVNALGMNFARRWDFTGSSQFTLTSQTKDFLQELDAPVEVITFFSPRVPYTLSSYARGLLNEYRDHSRNIVIEDIDPDVYPEQARQYGVDQTGAVYGAIVFKSGNLQRLVYGPEVAAGAEHSLTSALMEVTGVSQKKIYFLSGHGEGSIDGEFTGAANALRDNMFMVREIDLMTLPSVPEDTAALVIAGAGERFSNEEYRKIEYFLRSGGSLLLLTNPNPNEDIKNLLAPWGVNIPAGIIVDPSSYAVPSRESILIPRDRNSFQLSEIFFPGAAAIIPDSASARNLELLPLAWTSKEAWLTPEAGLEEKPENASGFEAPFALGAMISTKENTPLPKTRIVVIGDSDFALNENFHNSGNGELFLSSINWLSAGTEILTIDRKVLATRRFLLSPEQARFLNFSATAMFPLILLLVACFVWWNKR